MFLKTYDSYSYKVLEINNFMSMNKTIVTNNLIHILLNDVSN